MVASIFTDHQKLMDEIFQTSGKNKTAEYQKTAQNFADVLGIGKEYFQIYKLKNKDDDFIDFLSHFQSNLDLLISKTWVEKSDEVRKEILRSKIPSFMALVEKSKYDEAIIKFGEILEGLSYLFFGKQIFEDDFIEYASRIDTQMGLFWWYSVQLKKNYVQGTELDLRSLLLIGLCFLNNF
jgi:hypothetical protein